MEPCLAQPLVASALGGLVSHLRALLLDTRLLPSTRWTSYSPMRGNSLLLDGQVPAFMQCAAS